MLPFVANDLEWFASFVSNRHRREPVAATFSTTQPDVLLQAFKDAINHNTITTWKLHQNGHFFHTDHQTKGAAWFVPSVSQNMLIFNILKPSDSNVTPFIYSYYHGHLVETFLYHFSKTFSVVTVTAEATTGDSV